MRRALTASLALVAAACGGSHPSVEPPPAAVFAEPGQPLPGLSDELLQRFQRGQALLSRQFAPADGLGPSYSAVACSSCHEKPVGGGGASRYRAVFALTDAQPGFRVTFQSQYDVDPAAPLALTPPDVGTAVRNPIPFFGVGLLAEVSNDEIISRVDPLDADGDGIRGRVNYERGFISRFGRKAQVATLQGFVRLALLEHLGITAQPIDTSDLPGVAGPAELNESDLDGVPDPELPDGDLSDLMAFVALLAPPAPDAPTPLTESGHQHFIEAGCVGCHVPQLQGPRGPLPAFTDLLLHDMGEALADGVEVGDASASEFRTQPLWGLSTAGPYLHDGRADTIDAAIRAHGGEAAGARDRYVALDASARDALVAFLGSLGGSAYRSDGLLPKLPELPPAGALGAPQAGIDAAALALFQRGRELFDRDFAVSAGMGPEFNGDSCRSCHAAAAVGGAGPLDVDVMRVGTLLDGGTFVAPSSGTMAHRHLAQGGRPTLPPGVNVFERRQTPPLFGLGLIDGISDATLAARADPDDRDGDGIRGRVNLLPDGRVGRFGWKAGIATVAEFVVDALAGELGLTVPDAVRARTPANVGASSDTDALPDPEISADDVDALIGFVSKLAPPPRHSTDAAAEGRGEQVFASLGCAACHVPELPGAGGVMVPLYSDLLIHDVAPTEARRVIDPLAGRGFRTPPLWGLRSSAPYLHDGSAATVEEAIAQHEGEAARSAAAFASSSADDRASLAAFLSSL
jgi:CxxC motif-containing protein (DUF1111 family)